MPRSGLGRRQVRQGVAHLRARWYLRDADVVGARVRLRGRPVVDNRGRMLVHERVRLDSRVATLELATLPGGLLEIGPRSFVNYGSSLAAGELVRIGADCLVGTHAIIMDNDFHRLEPERRLEHPPSRPVEIEDNVWIGARVTVLGGVTIGAGAAVAAGSVVVDDVPPRTLVGGVPARVLRSL